MRLPAAVENLRWQIGLAVGGVLAIALIIITLADKATTVAPKRGGAFIEGLVGRPHVINPILAQTDSEVVLSRLIFSGLTRPAANGEVLPDLAESWDISSDGLSYTFFLRKDALWHDGRPVTADDVAFTASLAAHPSIEDKARLTESWQDVQPRVIDAHTIRFVLQQPYAPFLSATLLGILPAHLLADIEPSELATHRFSSYAPVGSGAFALTSSSEGFNNTIQLNRFPGHWTTKEEGSAGYLDELVFQLFPSTEDALDALGRQEISGLGNVPPSILGELSDDAQIYSAVQSGYTVIYLNPNQPIFGNTEIRRTLSNSINRSEIVANADLLDGQGVEALSPIPIGAWAHDPSTSPPVFDSDAVESALEDAGWIDSDDDGIRDRDGQPMQFALSVRSDNPLMMGIAEQIVADWKKIGLDVQIQPIPVLSMRSIVQNRAFDALLFDWELPDYDPDPYALWHSSQNEAPGNNYSGFTFEGLDDLLEAARSESPVAGRDGRFARYLQFQKGFVEEMPAILLYYPVYTYVVNKAEVGGIQFPELIVQPADRFLTLDRWYSQTERVLQLEGQ